MALADIVFEFERGGDGAELEWMPLAVRMKLDLAGLKLGLEDWQALTLETRRSLLAAPETGSGFVALLAGALRGAGRPAAQGLAADRLAARKAWLEGGRQPAEIDATGGSALKLAWDSLDRFDRFVLLHLARKGRRREFGSAAGALGLL